jgi:putative membrane protein
MRTYNGNRFFLILLKQVIPYHLIEVIRNTTITTCFALVASAINEETSVNIVITAPWVNTLNVFNFFLGMLISFRLNSAFGSWSTGVAQISSLENTASQLLNSLYAALLNDGFQEDKQDRLDFIWTFKNHTILYIANVFQNCSGDNGRKDNIRENYLSMAQLNERNNINSQVKHSKDMDEEILETCMVPRFYTRTLDLELRKLICSATNTFNLHPSVAGGLAGKIDKLSSINNTLYGMSNVPVVFIYNQFINFIIVTYLTLYTLMTIPASGYWSAFWVFIWSFIVFLANSIADEIDSPFGTDNNDIELEVILINIKDEYRVMYEYVTKIPLSV